MNKKFIPIIAAVVVLGLVLVLVLSNKSTKTTTENQGGDKFPTSAVVPTVDSSVKVTLEDAGRGEVELSIDGIPSGTDSLEYELSYNTVNQGLQGIVPDEPVSLSGKSTFSKKFLLGTESSGVRNIHKVDGPIKLIIKFNGSYGAKSFEKDFKI